MLNIAHRCFITLVMIVYINSKHYDWKKNLKKSCTILPLHINVLWHRVSYLNYQAKFNLFEDKWPNVLTNGLDCFVAGKISARTDPTSSPESFTWAVHHVKVENSYPGGLDWSELYWGQRGSMTLYSRALIDSAAALGHIELEHRLYRGTSFSQGASSACVPIPLLMWIYFTVLLHSP